MSKVRPVTGDMPDDLKREINISLAKAQGLTGDDVVSIDASLALHSGSYLTAVTIIRANLRNVLEGRALEFNEMTGRATIGRKPVDDIDETHIQCEIERRFITRTDKQGLKYGIQLAVKDINAAIKMVARERPYHPIREYLESLEWDGVPRIDSVVDDILSAKRTTLNMAMVKRFMIGAVARVMKPGCKLDTVFITIGDQGCGKSTFFKVLASDPWFVDSGVDLHEKDSFMVLRTCWFYEWGELDVMRRARDAAAVKAFLSSTRDTYRPPHGRNVIDVPRASIVVGSTNENEFLVDVTGNRRFWPLQVGRLNLEVLIEQRDQLWAEAVHLFHGGEQWHLTASEEALLVDRHAQHMVRDAWEAPIETWIGVQLKTEPFTTSDILANALSKPRGQWTRQDEMRVASVMKTLGWKLGNKPAGKARPWVQKNAPYLDDQRSGGGREES